MPKQFYHLRRRFLARLLGSGSLLALGAATAAHAADSTRAKKVSYGVVYHINDSSRAIAAIRNITNHRKADPKITIAVVTLGGGIDFLLEGAKDDRGNTYAALIDGLMFDNVSFQVCKNTLTTREISADEVHFGVTTVTSGAAEIARLQLEQGYAYYKP